jgi:peptide subunit release factor RF-3
VDVHVNTNARAGSVVLLRCILERTDTGGFRLKASLMSYVFDGHDGEHVKTVVHTNYNEAGDGAYRSLAAVERASLFVSVALAIEEEVERLRDAGRTLTLPTTTMTTSERMCAPTA